MENIQCASSEELIDLLANMGYGKPFDKNNNDLRRAYVNERGTISSGPLKGKHFAKIVVQCNNDELWDYGLRIWIKDDPFIS